MQRLTRDWPNPSGDGQDVPSSDGCNPAGHHGRTILYPQLPPHPGRKTHAGIAFQELTEYYDESLLC